MKERIEFIDLAKGFCILLVIFSHINSYYGLNYALKDCLGIFRMPLYFYLSGLFFSSYNGLSSFLKKKINKLLIPFLFFYITTSVMLPNILSFLGYNIRNENALGIRSLWAFFDLELFPNGPIWFLLCLFIVNFIFYILKIVSDTFKYNIFILTIACIIIGYIGYWLGSNKYNLPMFIDTSFTSLPFFLFGYLSRKYTSILYKNKFDRYNLIIILLCFIYIYIFSGPVEYFRNEYKVNILELYISGFIGILFIILLSKIIQHIPIISYYGKYSIVILCTHNLLIQPIYLIINKYISGWYAIAVIFFSLLILYVFVIPVFIKRLPYFTAQKDLLR